MNENLKTNTYFEARPPQNESTGFSWGRLVFLGLMSAALSSFQLFWLFVPVPLTMAILIYGRGKGLALGVLGIGALLVLSLTTQIYPLAAVTVFAGAFIEAAILGEIIIRKMNPIKGMLVAGLLMLAIVVAGIATTHFFGKVSIHEATTQAVTQFIEQVKSSNTEIMNGSGEEARIWRDYMEQPGVLADKIIAMAPMAIFGSIYFGLWLCLFIILRNSLVWKERLNYPYVLKDLIEFRVPFNMVWGLIFGLVMYLLGGTLYGEQAEIWGETIIYCTGVFYFFQGFGVFSELLNKLRLFGFTRAIMIVLTVFTAWRLIALVGLFDVWFNFRKYFKKKNDEGDML